ncbi:MAG: HEPN domain-containing protein [Thermoflexaceae bacterium]|nr:HEPN domain-containing protein [Thermoflexaceae bacterium]
MADARSEQVREWMVRASDDLRAAAAPIDSGITGPSLFHCQQAGEKAIKALLVWHDVPFGKTHDLVALIDNGSRIVPELAGWTRAAAILTPLASLFRYPGADLEPGRDDAESAMGHARGIYGFVLSQLPGEARP